jgi:diguanylate cyclase (GGDEF)-like protein
MQLFLLPPGSDAPIDTEAGQARIRIVSILVILACYAVAIWMFGQGQLIPALPGLLLYLGFGYAWIWLVAWDTAAVAWRQRSAVVLDHAIFSLGLAWAGIAMAPLLWAPAFISVGHGLRFGNSRARFSAVVGAVSIGVAMYAAPEGHYPPLVALGIVLSALLIPIYAVSLAQKIEILRRASESKALALEKAARIDGLTTLLNRAGFERAVREACDETGSAKEPVAVLYLDLDGFKTVNDTLGHTAGDHVLRETALQLRRSLRTGDSIARVGGDEFAVLLRSPGNREALARIGGKLLDALGRISPSDGSEPGVHASIGICIAGRGCSVADAVERADKLMYEAKRAGKSQIRMEEMLPVAPAGA